MAALNPAGQPPAALPLWRRPVSRRAVLLAGGGALVFVGVRASGSPLSSLTAATERTSTLHLVRPQDMLVLDYDFYNLMPSPESDPPQLRRIDSSARSYIVAHFESQHVMEQTVADQATDPPGPGSLAAKGVGPSRIAFVVPETVKDLPYSEDGLLQWWRWIMQVVSGPSVPDELHTDLLLVDWLHISPDQVSTWAHASAPVEHNGRTELWHTRLSTRGADGKPHETIGVVRPPEDTIPTVRAVHADAATAEEAQLFGTLPAADRPNGKLSVPKQIVQLSSDTSVDVYRPVRADLLSLSATGATLDLEGKWDASTRQDLDVAGWEHHAWQGRDNKVVVEEYGFLFPFGHRARQITETKRKFDARTGVAYLRQRRRIRISEPVKQYPALHQRSAGRAFPFTDIAIRTVVLPDLPEPGEAESLVPGNDNAYWIQDVNTRKADGSYSDVVFAVTATDLTGRRVEFTTPMGFILKDSAVFPKDALLVSVLNRYGSYADIVGSQPNRRRVIDLGGQEVAYAPEKTPGTTSFPTARWYWGVEPSVDGVENPLPPGQVPDPSKKYASVDSAVFYPVLLAAQAQVPAIDALIGPGGPVFLVHDDVYLARGLGGNKALAAAGNDPEIFVRVQDSVDAISKRHQAGADKPVIRRVQNSVQAGGIATPHLAVGALSASLGQVSGSQESIDKVRDTGKLVFKDYFPDLADGLKQAALFGEILLSNLFEDGDVSVAGPRLQKVREYPKDKDGRPDTTKEPIGQTVTLYWQKDPVSFGPLVVNKDQFGNTLSRFILECVNHVDYYKPKESTVTVAGRLTDFTLVFVGADAGHRYIDVEFKRFGFKMEVSGKPKFDVEVGEVNFAGPFEFVNALRSFISGLFGGSSAPGAASSKAAAAAGGKPKGKPIIDVDGDHVTLGASLSIPHVPLGLFSISGISFSGALVLPFTGDPVRARFGFSRPNDKFLVTAYGLGGGGHFIIEISTRGLELIEASIELAGNVELDLIIAAGRLTIEAGIAFRLVIGHSGPDPSDVITLTGYLRATGRLSVLGLITITAEFYLALEYQNKGGEATVTGRGRVTVSVDILFFHKQVSIELEKTFVGGGSGTGSLRALAATNQSRTFGDLVSRDDWSVYCASFAG